MAQFVNANQQRQLDEWRFVANAAYSSGCIASMALAKKRPRFEEVFSFPKPKAEPVDDAALSKAQMIAWAISSNLAYEKAANK